MQLRKVAALVFPLIALTACSNGVSTPDTTVPSSDSTIPDVARALQGMRRVLRPGGRLIFCEHGRAPDDGVRRWQERLTPMWKRIAGGCHLGRPIPELVREAGFAIETLETMYLPSTPRFTGFNYWGTAR